MKEGPPKDIEKSIKERNIEHLRAAGRKGAKKTNEIKDIKKSMAELEIYEKLAEDEVQRRASNEHIISPDGVDMDYNSDSDQFDKN